LSESLGIFRESAERFPRERRHDRPKEGAFTATEIICHMLAVEDLWRERIAKLISGGDRQFQAMNPDEDARSHGYNDRDYDAGLETLIGKRVDTIALIGRLQPEQFGLTGVHSKYGEMAIHQMFETMESHDRQHAAQLDRTLRELEALAAG
jgi:uncharacterized damage-inducible protein DinB